MAGSLFAPMSLSSSIWGSGHCGQSSLWPGGVSLGSCSYGRKGRGLKPGCQRHVHVLASARKAGPDSAGNGSSETKNDKTPAAFKFSVEFMLKSILPTPPTPVKLSLGVYPFVNLDPLGVFSTDNTYINVDPLGVFMPFISDPLGVFTSTIASTRSVKPQEVVKRGPKMRSMPSVSQMGKQVVAAAVKIQADLSTMEKPTIPGFAPPPRTPSAMHPKRRAPKNKYLDGNFRPVEEEVTDELSCQVLGTIPEGLRGRFLRNGPNPQFPPTPSQYHWFDGDGMVHCVRFHEDGASYSSHYIRTKGFEDERKAGQPLYVGLGALINFAAGSQLRSILSRAVRPRVRDTPPWCGMKNPANNHLIMHAGRLLALWEAGYPYELDPAQLSTKGVQAFEGELVSSFTAHPKMDPRTGHLMYYGYNLLRKPYLQYGVIDKAGDIVHRADITLDAPVYMHDFAITENYTIFLDFPVVFSIERMVQSHGTSKPFLFDPEHPARIGVMPRFGDDSSVQWFRVEPGFVNHAMNAYEEVSDGSYGLPPGGTTVVLHASRFQSFSALNMADMPNPAYANNEICRLHEWRLHLPTGQVFERPVSPVCSDFLCVNPSYTGIKHRYGYSAHYEMQPGPGNATPLFDGMIKHDLDNATAEIHFYGLDRYGGEPIFIPNLRSPSSKTRSPKPSSSSAKSSSSPASATPHASIIDSLRVSPNFPSFKRRDEREEAPAERKEDDGWLVVHVWDEFQKQSEVVVVDAKNVRGPPLARLLIPRRVPYGFHGIFVGEDDG